MDSYKNIPCIKEQSYKTEESQLDDEQRHRSIVATSDKYQAESNTFRKNNQNSKNSVLSGEENLGSDYTSKASKHSKS